MTNRLYLVGSSPELVGDPISLEFWTPGFKEAHVTNQTIFEDFEV